MWPFAKKKEAFITTNMAAMYVPVLSCVRAGNSEPETLNAEHSPVNSNLIRGNLLFFQNLATKITTQFGLTSNIQAFV